MFEKGYQYDLLIELIDVARDRGSNIFTFRAMKMSDPEMSHEEYFKKWVGRFLNHEKLLNDFKDYINDKRSLNAVADPQHILENILLPDDSSVNKTKLNADALCDAMREVYPRYRRKPVDAHQLAQTMTTQQAAEYLNITVGAARKAMQRNKLKRAGRGRVTRESVIAYKR